MLLKYFYDTQLAHASYLVGCQRSGEAIVVDPGRDIEPYLAAAHKEGLRIVGAAETHIHADYVSGMRELAARVGAKLYVSDAGPADWKYQFLADYPHQLLTDGSRFTLGKIEFETLHTPGHTPESICFLLTDRGGGADQPMGIFTGDFVFVGAIGRPDLLEEAAGVIGSADIGARQLYHSIERFKTLPDYLQVWPAHGAGSACGKGLGAIPSSTVGYEKKFNPGLQFNDEQSFVEYILSEQPEAPRYFALMKKVNKVGPQVLGPDPYPHLLPADQLPQLPSTAQVIDTGSVDQFAQGHWPGSYLIPSKSLATWAGWLIDEQRPVFLIAEKGEVPELTRVLQKIGIDQVAGYFEPAAVRGAGLRTEPLAVASPTELAAPLSEGHYTLLDVRAQSEWDQGHLPGAHHFFLGRLPTTWPQIPRDRPIVVQCRSGARSAIAASFLQAQGLKQITNLSGGILAWQNQGLPTVVDSCGSGCGCS